MITNKQTQTKTERKMEKHFKLTEETIVNEAGHTLHRIEATRDTRHAKAGEKGGFVEKESNLADEAWVADDARVWGEARLYGYSYAGGQARIYEKASMHNLSRADGESRVYGHSMLIESARVMDNAHVFGYTKLSGSVRIGRDAFVGHTKGYCSLLNIGRPNQQTTAYRAADGSVRIAFGEDVYPIDQVNKSVVRRFNGNEDYRMYQAVIDLIKLKFNLA